MDKEFEMAEAAIAALAKHNIPADIQDLLVYGDPARGIAPGALSKAILALIQAAQSHERMNNY